MRFRKRIVALKAHIEKLERLRTPPTGLLRLPFEIRLQIYGYCIPQKRVIEVIQPYFDTSFEDCTLEFEDNVHIVANPDMEFDPDSEYGASLQDRALDPEDYAADYRGDYWNHKKNKSSVFLISKQISKEALDVLYGENMFMIHLHEKGEILLKNFSEANRQRMRYLLVTAEPRGVSYTPGRMPDNALWCSVLPQLKMLRIVAEQPLHYYNAPTLEQDIDCWLNWIRPFLQCFRRHLSKHTTVQIDGDGRLETMALIKECLPGGYREVRCRLAGDFIFKRGRFSWESGYWDDDGPMNSHDAGYDLDSD
ncbi:hypothetical protein O988_05224 [Pseudogymnoascus sp. VKM F-3808]|nr:hypothetical protein O988_05224 [Pseudogymnoascus sp. VKM F-3808]